MGLLRKLLAETSRDRAEWIIWVDADTIIQVRMNSNVTCGVQDITNAVILWRLACLAAAALDVWRKPMVQGVMMRLTG